MFQLTASSRVPGRCSGCRPAFTPARLHPSLLHNRRSHVIQSVNRRLPRSERLHAATKDDVQPVPDLMIPESDLECDRRWISGIISTWLDEEWTPLEVHQQLGKAAGDAYVKCRQEGTDDMSSLVLGLSSELLSFNYRETFTNAFEVSNKVVEMLMMRSGVDVCCTTDTDAARIERFSSQQEVGEQ